jgi:Amidohydrolase family
MILLTLFQAVALQGGTVHTMVPGEPPLEATILVEDGLISAIGADLELPEDARLVDASGLHIVPGLIDGMVHHDLQHDPVYLLSGVSLVRDMGNDVGRIFLSAQPNVRNSMPGPDLFVCGPIFDGVPPATTEAAVVQSAAEVDDKLARLIERGAQFTTFHLGIPHDAWKRLIEASHESELQCWGPLPKGVTLTEALAQGQDGLCYLEGFRGEGGKLLEGEALDAAIAQLKESGAALTPLMRVYGYRTEDPGENSPMLDLIAPYYADWWEHDLSQRKPLMEDPEYITRGRADYAELAALLKQLSDAGVPLVPGSAAPNPWMLPGEALHDELQAFVEAGITPIEALRCATATAATALGVDEQRGTLQVGLSADLVLSSSDPRESLEGLRRPQGVVIRGVWLDHDYLTELRATLIEVQQEARVAAALPLEIEKPELPEGTVVLEGRVESTAYERVVAAEEYWVIRCFDSTTAWVSRMVTPASIGVAPTLQTLTQRFEGKKFQGFDFEVQTGDFKYRVEGLVIGGQFRLKRWMNDFYLDTNSSANRPHFVDAGLALPAMLLAHYRGEGSSQVIYFENIEPAVSTWECQLGDNDIYAVRTATGPLVAAVHANGAFDKQARTEGKSAVRYASVRESSFGGPGMPRKAVEKKEEAETEGESPEVPTPGDSE